MYRNSPKSIPEWVSSDSKIVIGGFGRGKGKTRAVAEKASKFGGKVLILVSLLPQKKVIQNYLSEMNVSASTDISLAAIDFVSRIKHQYDLVIIDEPDYTLTDRILSHIGQARQWAKQIAVIGSVYTLESDCIVEFDVDGTPYVRCKPKSNLLYLMSLFADDKDAELIGEENMIDTIDDDLESSDFIGVDLPCTVGEREEGIDPITPRIITTADEPLPVDPSVITSYINDHIREIMRDVVLAPNTTADNNLIADRIITILHGLNPDLCGLINIDVAPDPFRPGTVSVNITSSTLASTDRPIDIELQFQQGE